MIKAPKEPVRVSDHAVLRYLERGMGLNIEIVREHIAALCAVPAAVGATCLRSEGLRFEIANNAVITVRPDGAAPSKTGQERASHAIRRSKQYAEL